MAAASPPQPFHSKRFPGLSGKNQKHLEQAEAEFAQIDSRKSTILCVQDRSLVSLPDKFEGYARVSFINCSRNPLTKLPSALGDCVSLQWLYCDGTDIATIPSNISNCAKLEVLSCNDGQLRALPISMAKLTHLSEISCKNNQLQMLPALRGLSSAAFAGNNWDATWLESIAPPGAKLPKPCQDIPLAWLQE